MEDYVLLTVGAPLDAADKVRQAIGDANGGRLGHYSHGSFSLKGTGRGIALSGANPAVGEQGQLEEAEEEKIEVVCKESDVAAIIKAIKSVHPYEEPVILVFPVKVYQ